MYFPFSRHGAGYRNCALPFGGALKLRGKVVRCNETGPPEVIWDPRPNGPWSRRVRTIDEMVSLGLPYAEIRDRMKDLEDELLGPLLAEAEEVHQLAVEERGCRDW